MRSSIAAFLAAVVLGAAAPGALAQPAPAGFAAAAHVQSRPDKVGDRYSFSAETEERVRGALGERVTHDVQDFDIELLKVSPQGLTVRYVQTGGEIKQSARPESKAILQAWTGLPVVIETDPSGYPLRILDAAKVKSDFLARLTPLSAQTPQLPVQASKTLDAATPEQLASNVVGDKLAMMASLQLRGFLPVGRQDLPSETQRDADGTEVPIRHTFDIGPAAEAPCRVEIRRSTYTERPGGEAAPQSSVTTTAVLDESDGWVVELTEVEKDRTPDRNRVKTTRIVRKQPAACPR